MRKDEEGFRCLHHRLGPLRHLNVAGPLAVGGGHLHHTICDFYKLKPSCFGKTAALLAVNLYRHAELRAIFLAP